MLSEARLFANPWGGWLPDLSIPVHLFHGEMDRIVPVGIARRLEHAIPDCRARYYPADGHFSVVSRYFEEVIGLVRSA
jgi:pimeloyl-ACP methyl ester carboxylesterase